MPKRPSRLARFPNLNTLRTGLGWGVPELVAHLPDGRPGSATIYRLEAGQATREVGCVRIFEVLNREYLARGNPALVRLNEIIPEAGK